MSKIQNDWEEIKKDFLTEEETVISDIETEILKALVDARNEKKLTQKQFEELCGVKQPMIARIENGDTTPRIDTLIKMLTPLGLTLKVVPIEKKN